MRMSASLVEAQIIDFRRVETLGDNFTVLRVLGRLMEERRILSKSFVPTLISDSALWQKQKGKDSCLPTCIFSMRDVKEEDDHMKDSLHERSSAL